MAQVKLVTMAEYARLRDVSQAAVSKAVKEGRISLIDGKVDPAVADVQWSRNSRARAGSGGPATDAVAGTSSANAGAGQAPARDEGDYWVNRARREAAEADLAEMRREEQAGRLISVEAVRSALATVLAATRDSLLQIPARVAPVLAAESDPAKVHDLVEQELHQALTQLASSPNRLAGAPVASVEAL
ncbi:MAG: hypothetical protein WBC18_07895 [Ottowia sp.]|uniref:hypothetical protein n=1 Tax=Ottowia sp. TaxID=1898956 RepID=UPI003C7904ED